MQPIETDFGKMSSLGILTGWFVNEEQVAAFNNRQAALGLKDMASVGPVIMIERWLKEELTKLEFMAVLLHEEGYAHNVVWPVGTLTLAFHDTDNIYPEVSVKVDLELLADAYAVANGANADALVEATYKLIRRQREKVGTGFYRGYKIYKDIYRARFDALKPYCFKR
jgi:hypothetical protein